MCVYIYVCIHVYINIHSISNIIASLLCGGILCIICVGIYNKIKLVTMTLGYQVVEEKAKTAVTPPLINLRIT